MASETLPEGWRFARLGDLGEVNRGRSRHRPRDAAQLYGGPYPFVQTGDIKSSGGLISSFEQSYSEAGLAQSRLWPARTMCITIAANIAETALLSFPACFPDSVVGFIGDDAKCNIRFVEYAFRNLRRRIQNEASGSVQDNINLATLARLRFPLPPLSEQNAIASVLGALDDKILCSQRINRTLEAIARAIFKSWFVDFDPVRAKAEGREPEGMDAATATLFPSEFEDSGLGAIPKGWRTGGLEDCVDFLNSKRVPLSSAQRALRHGEFPYYGAAGPIDFVDGFLFDGEFVLVGEDGSVIDADGRPVVQHVWGKFWVSNHAHVLKPRGGWSIASLRHLLAGVEIRPFVTGAVQPKLSMTNLKRVPVVLPPEPILAAYARSVGCMEERERLNTEMISSLSEIRDTLLPRLISGKLRLPEAEAMLSGGRHEV